MLFALVQNYVHAGVASLVPDRGDSIVNTADIQPSIDHEIVPSYGVHHQENDFDFDTDDSYQRFLTTNRPFKDLDYVPSDLAPINSNFTANDARKFKLRQKAGDMFADMAWHFWDDFT